MTDNYLENRRSKIQKLKLPDKSPSPLPPKSIFDITINVPKPLQENKVVFNKTKEILFWKALAIAHNFKANNLRKELLDLIAKRSSLYLDVHGVPLSIENLNTSKIIDNIINLSTEINKLKSKLSRKRECVNRCLNNAEKLQK